MSVRRPLIMVAGRKKELPAGDTLPGVASVNTQEGALTLRMDPAVQIQGGFDAAQSAPTIALSNGNLTATFASHTTARVATAIPVHGGGLRYFEITFASGANSGDCAVGVVGPAPNTSHQIGYDGAINEVGMFQNTGRVYVNGVVQLTAAPFDAPGAVVGVAVNKETRRIWFRVNGGEWNGDELANPVTGAGGVAILGTGDILPAACTPAVATFNFNPAAAFSGAFPWGEFATSGTIRPTDVDIVSPMADEILQFNGVQWANAGFAPFNDNARPLGGADRRWTQVYAATGTINTSDARDKTGVATLTPAELAAATDLGREIGTYQWLAMVATKGEAARNHIGLTVQRAMQVLVDHGLEPLRYGFICHDRWGEVPEVRDAETGELIQAFSPAGDRYSFRMDELLAFVARGIAHRLDAVEQRLTVVEQGA